MDSSEETVTPERSRFLRFLIGAVAVGIAAVMAGTDLLTVPRSSFQQGETQFNVELIDGPFDAGSARVIDWIKASARAVETYYGAFPAKRVDVRVTGRDGRGIHGGKADPAPGGGRVRIRVGRQSVPADLDRDWTMTHEMLHLAFPSLASEHHWLEEGLATYVEPWARVRAGALRREQVWADLVRDLPQGLPQPGDRGLDQTPTWARIYWGGALFCLLADVQICEETKNRKSLRDALQAIARAGGVITQEWPIERVLAVGDEATGTRVLSSLYAKMATAPYPVDLNALWARLGVRDKNGAVTLDEAAPAARTRRIIEGR